METPKCFFSVTNGIIDNNNEIDVDDDDDDENDAAYAPRAAAISKGVVEASFTPSVGDLVDLRCEMEFGGTPKKLPELMWFLKATEESGNDAEEEEEEEDPNDSETIVDDRLDRDYKTEEGEEEENRIWKNDEDNNNNNNDDTTVEGLITAEELKIVNSLNFTVTKSLLGRVFQCRGFARNWNASLHPPSCSVAMAIASKSDAGEF